MLGENALVRALAPSFHLPSSLHGLVSPSTSFPWLVVRPWLFLPCCSAESVCVPAADRFCRINHAMIIRYARTTFSLRACRGRTAMSARVGREHLLMREDAVALACSIHQFVRR